MATTDAQKRARAKFNAKTYEHATLNFKKGKKGIVADIAKSQGESLNSYVMKALMDKIKADTGENVDL